MAARGLRRRAVLTVGRAPTKAEHLERVASCALALDARRWSAHTTALDGLWKGVGTLNVAGATPAARAAHAIHMAIGAGELSAASLRAEADLATALLHEAVPRVAAIESPAMKKAQRRPPFTRKKWNPVHIESLSLSR